MATKNASSRGRRSCMEMPKEPVFYTSTIRVDGHNLLTISAKEAGFNYRLSGWLETVLSPGSKGEAENSITATLKVMNITAKLLPGEGTGKVPRKLHLRCAVPHEEVGVIDSKTGLGLVRIPVEISYP